jgi:hypothetical protein
MADRLARNVISRVKTNTGGAVGVVEGVGHEARELRSLVVFAEVSLNKGEEGRVFGK